MDEEPVTTTEIILTGGDEKGKEEALIAEETTTPNNDVVENLEFIFDSLSRAQKSTGKFTLVDCKTLMVAYRSLHEFLSGFRGDGEIPNYARESYKIISVAAGVQQSTGIFTIEGSAKIVDALLSIENAIRAIPK